MPFVKDLSNFLQAKLYAAAAFALSPDSTATSNAFTAVFKDELNDAVQSEESVDEESVQTEEEAQDSNDGELSQNTESENGVQAINQNTNTSSGATVTTTQKDVHNFTELQDALKQSNIIINIKSDTIKNKFHFIKNMDSI